MNFIIDVWNMISLLVNQHLWLTNFPLELASGIPTKTKSIFLLFFIMLMIIFTHHGMVIPWCWKVANRSRWLTNEEENLKQTGIQMQAIGADLVNVVEQGYQLMTFWPWDERTQEWTNGMCHVLFPPAGDRWGLWNDTVVLRCICRSWGYPLH